MKIGTFWGIVTPIALVLTVVCLLPSIASNTPLQAQQPNCKDPQTTVDLNMCANQEFQAADKKLNQLYQQVQAKLNSKQKQRLTAAQRTWIEFRDKSCDYEMGQYEGGTLAASTYGYCRVSVTQARIKDLERYWKQVNL